MPPLSRPVLLATLLLSSVGLKLSIMLDQPAESAEQALVTTKRDVSAWLAAKKFTRIDSGSHDSPLVHAAFGQCRLAIVVAHPAGFHRALIRQLAADADDHVFLYDGMFHDSQPVWRTWFDHQAWQRLRDVGISLPRRPVLGLVGSGCDLRSPLFLETDQTHADFPQSGFKVIETLYKVIDIL